MKIFIDADGCPVVDITVQIAKKNSIECIIICDTSHVFNKDGAQTITVSKGADSVDFALVNMLKSDDIAITQDYGLAAMCLAKAAKVISQDGMVYDSTNIDALLMQRYTAKKIRMAGGRISGNAKRTTAQNEKFKAALQKMIEEVRI